MGAWVNVGSWLRIYQARSGTFGNELCISAHGEYSSGYGRAQIPGNARVYLYELHGSTQLDNRSRGIMKGLTPEDCGITGHFQGGSIWDYHLTKFEGDAEHVPLDVQDAVNAASTDAYLAGLGIGGGVVTSIVRDVVSIRNRKTFGANWIFGVPLSYVFRKVADTHAYQVYHLCFCRYVQGGWKYNPNKKRYINQP